jgi:hypothetical protein
LALPFAVRVRAGVPQEPHPDAGNQEAQESVGV